jgi:hypothetical protein
LGWRELVAASNRPLNHSMTADSNKLQDDKRGLKSQLAVVGKFFYSDNFQLLTCLAFMNVLIRLQTMGTHHLYIRFNGGHVSVNYLSNGRFKSCF